MINFHIFVGKEVAKILIENGANVNSKANDGMTPLHRAARSILVELGEVLLDNGADIKILDNMDRTARDIAVQYRNILKNSNQTNQKYSIQTILFIQTGKLDFVAMLDRHQA